MKPTMFIELTIKQLRDSGHWFLMIDSYLKYPSIY